MIDVTDRADVAMGLVTLEFLFGHDGFLDGGFLRSGRKARTV
jgi:hypothetical protein